MMTLTPSVAMRATLEAIYSRLACRVSPNACRNSLKVQTQVTPIKDILRFVACASQLYRAGNPANKKQNRDRRKARLWQGANGLTICRAVAAVFALRLSPSSRIDP
ncbi:hypothetical protein ACE103_05215 [Bradyrhizobium sp. ma5]|uniref:hypothetical protein n=1 Tax=Bradyrhizobium sp. ma5 TaxID=3344828 RepID=UPI0035D40883